MTGPKSRGEALDRLSSRAFDLLVVGGGISGAGIALDAATRGLSVALIERGDFAQGTSSKSSKLIHGGLRYLEHREFGLMHESASERDLLRRIAPHLVTPIPFFWPRWSGGRGKAGVGLWIYDVLAGFRNVRRHERVDDERASRLVPGAKRTGGGYVYYDSQTDDSRLTLAVLRGARAAGAVVCNHLTGEQFLEVGGRVTGAAARDVPTGARVEIRAGDVVNATGVWADDLRLREAENGERLLRPSKGIHILLPARALPLRAACVIPAPDRGLLFAAPWRSSVIVGTTDTPYEGSLDTPAVSADEVAYMLEALSRSFDREFAPGDVAGSYAGLRPLLDDPARAETRDLSRRHAILRGPKGVVTITGGKLTTYRRMAEEVVDLVCRRQGRVRRCVTASIRLGITDVDAVRSAVRAEAAALGLPEEVADSLTRSYGDQASAVLSLGREMELLEPVADGLPYLMAEVVWGIREEMAMTVEDVLSRRTRLALEDPGGGLGRRELLSKLLSGEFRISPADVSAQIEQYRARLASERGPALSVAAVRG